MYLFSLKVEKYNFQACLSKKNWIKDLANVQNQFTIPAHLTETLNRTVLHVNWLGLSAFTEKLLKNPRWQIGGKQKTREIAVFKIQIIIIFFIYNRVLDLLRNWTRHWMQKKVHIDYSCASMDHLVEQRDCQAHPRGF